MKFTIRLSFILLLLALIATTVIAQGGNDNTGDDDDTPAPSSESDPPPPAEETPPPTNNDDEETPPPPPPPDEEEEEPPADNPESETTEAPPRTTSTKEEDPETKSNTGPAPPRLTTTSSSSLTSATLPSGTPTSLVTTTASGKPKPKLYPTYAPPAVPYTADAPFMQRSSLPQGTFFIAVGAALGLLLFTVVAWRALVAWSLHRSVKRAADEANSMDKTALMRPPGGGSGGFYAAGAGSALSLGDLGTTKSGAAKQTPNSSLFFSPTAGVGSQAGDRRSAYLPAGYYPTSGAGNNLGGGPTGASQTHFPSQSISSGRYGSRGGLGPSPPGSPLIPPSRGNGSGTLRGSESRTSLSLPPTGRAPSAYLEDLFENHQQQPGGRY